MGVVRDLVVPGLKHGKRWTRVPWGAYSIYYNVHAASCCIMPRSSQSSLIDFLPLQIVLSASATKFNEFKYHIGVLPVSHFALRPFNHHVLSHPAERKFAQVVTFSIYDVNLKSFSALSTQLVSKEELLRNFTERLLLHDAFLWAFLSVLGWILSSAHATQTQNKDEQSICSCAEVFYGHLCVLYDPC